MGEFYLCRNSEKESVKIDLMKLPSWVTTKVGYQFETGSGGLPQNYENAMRCYRVAENRNDATAVNNIGWAYLNGNGVPQNVILAAKKFLKAADAGSTLAMVNLGNIYEGNEDYEPAYYWYFKATEGKNPKGAFNCANMIFHGWGVEQDYQFAYEIFKRLYDAGYYDGTCFYLGLYAENDWLDEADYDLAKAYYEKGIEETEDPYCFTNLGRMYALGLGVTRNLEKAYDFYKNAGNLGDALGYTNLAWMYETGTYVGKNLREALRLYRIASDMGDGKADLALIRLKNKNEIK